MTMYRYMAFMWDAADAGPARAAAFLGDTLHQVSPHRWEQAWSGDGLAIHHSGEQKGRMQTYRLKGGRGAVLGRLFRSDYTSVVDDPGEYESRRILETGGQRLIDDYWGRYVAFLDDAPSRTRYVLRDPSGAFPCFYTRWRGVTIYFSDMQDAAAFEFLPFTVNWDYVRANIALPFFQKNITGLAEVSEVLPAEHVEIKPGWECRKNVWNPAEIAQRNVVYDAVVAEMRLRETIMATIGALAGCFDRVLINLGGLDSSIALACIVSRVNNPETTCITNFTRSLRGDERFYTRQVAGHFNVPLVEFELDARMIDLRTCRRMNKEASPHGVFDCIALTGHEFELARETSAQALFTGAGGDNVFFQAPRFLGALDYIRSHPFVAKETFLIAFEAARYGRTSIWKTLKEMARERVSREPCYEYVHNTLFGARRMPLVDPKLWSEGSYKSFLHPQLIPDHDFLKGKYHHLMGCALFPNRCYDQWDCDYTAGRVHPFFSQPIIELCLQIPTWILTYGGIDRGLARRAFREHLPHDVIMRVSKSTPQTFYDEICRCNRSFLREALLDGRLVTEDILRRDKLEAALGDDDVKLQLRSNDLLGFAATEVWAEEWPARNKSAIA